MALIARENSPTRRIDQPLRLAIRFVIFAARSKGRPHARSIDRTRSWPDSGSRSAHSGADGSRGVRWLIEQAFVLTSIDPCPGTSPKTHDYGPLT